MKKFIAGFLSGAILFGTVGAFAVTYIAQPAGFKVLVNGKEFQSDPPALEVEGRTYLPLRAMGEALGVPVNWNEELNQAEVGSAGGVAGLNKIDGNATVDGVEFSQLTLSDMGSGFVKCDVNLKNNTGKDLNNIMFNVVFYDSEGNRLFVAGPGVIAATFKNGETRTVIIPSISKTDLSKATNAKYEFTFDINN